MIGVPSLLARVVALLARAPELPDAPAEAAIEWHAPAECGDARVLRDAIAHRLGRAPRVDELRLVGDVTKDGERFRLELRTEVGAHTDTRTLEAASCTSLREAAALVAAVSIDAIDTVARIPVASVESPTGAPSVAPVREEVPQARPTVRRVEPPPAPRRRTALPSVRVSLHGGFGLGASPGIAGALALGIGTWWRRAGVELRGHYVTPRRASSSAGSVRVQLGAAELRGCGRLHRDRIDVPLCAGLELGAMRGDAARTRTGVWLGAIAGAELWGRVHPRVELGAGATAGVPIVRPSFRLREPGPARALFVPAAVTVRVLAGIRIRLGPG